MRSDSSEGRNGDKSIDKKSVDKIGGVGDICNGVIVVEEDDEDRWCTGSAVDEISSLGRHRDSKVDKVGASRILTMGIKSCLSLWTTMAIIMFVPKKGML